MGFKLILHSTNGVDQYVFNDVTFIPQVGSSFNLSPVQIPRAHQSRVLDPAYLAGRAISFAGVLATATQDGSIRGAAPWAAYPDTPELYLNELRRLYAFLHGQNNMILDYRNGFINYVKLQGITSSQESGWPDMRGLQIAVFASDPLGYTLEQRTATLASNTATLDMSSDLVFGLKGNAPTRHWRLVMLSTTSRVVQVRQVLGNLSVANATFSVDMVANYLYLIDGYNRVIRRDVSAPTNNAALDWRAWKTGSKFPTLSPNEVNKFSFYTSTGAAITIGSEASAESLRVSLVSHDADWLVDTFPVGTNIPPGVYNTALYDLDVFGA